jgi:hypothetical protein
MSTVHGVKDNPDPDAGVRNKSHQSLVFGRTPSRFRGEGPRLARVSARQKLIPPVANRAICYTSGVRKRATRSSSDRTRERASGQMHCCVSGTQQPQRDLNPVFPGGCWRSDGRSVRPILIDRVDLVPDVG